MDGYTVHVVLQEALQAVLVPDPVPRLARGPIGGRRLAGAGSYEVGASILEDLFDAGGRPDGSVLVKAAQSVNPGAMEVLLAGFGGRSPR